MEPDRRDGMDWYPLDALPDPMAAYCRAGLDAYRAGLPAAVHFQQPGDAIEYGPDGVDRTRLLAGPPVGEAELPYRLRVFAERAIGRIAQASEVSWGPDRQPGTEAHRSRRRHLVPEAARSPPRPVAADAEARAVVVTVLPGRPLHGIVLDPADGARIQHGLGRLASALHRSAPERPADSATARRHAGTIKPHLEGARPYLSDGDQDLVLALAGTYARLPLPSLVPTHGDLQYRNVLLDDDGEPLLLDCERFSRTNSGGLWGVMMETSMRVEAGRGGFGR
nr:phosphotransferase [Streptomyces sp. NBC_00853]